ncbi:MAG TPA: FHA domain-containing protein, partial [Planctomycetota bacterium]|nr:FHA domain-containing protein [Planctomycetota bacterium]
MRAFLNGQQGNIPVPAGSNILGRGQDCGLRIDDPRLSRHHARLLHDGSTLIIEDLGSTNGVLVNGERIHGKKNLLSGNTV